MLSNGVTSEDLAWFLHIPKTAGSSFRADLARRLNPHDSVVLIDPALEGFKGRRRELEAMRLFIQRNSERPLRLGMGHVQRRNLGPILAGTRPVRLITMLRDPVARVISDFRYARTPAHPAYQQFIAKFPRFEDYLDSSGSQNKMVAFLRLDDTETVPAIAQRMAREFAFIGFTEHYSASIRLLDRVLGIDRQDSQASFERKTLSSADNQIEDLEAWHDRIVASNFQDISLYELLWEQMSLMFRSLSEPDLARDNSR